MLSSHTCFSKKQCCSQLFYLKSVFSVGMPVFVLACVTPPTASLANSISTLRVASWQKTHCIAAIEAFKQTGSEITDSSNLKSLCNKWNIMWINQLHKLQYKACCLSLSVALIPVARPQSGKPCVSSVRRRGQEKCLSLGF